MIKIYHNTRCSKSRCGLDILENSGKNFEVVKYLETTPDKNELNHIISLLGITPLQLIRKGESIWKEQFKSNTYTNEELIDIMVMHPKLIERPIVINGDKAVIGRPPELILDILQ